MLKPHVITYSDRPQQHELAPHEVLINVKAGGICGSDLHIYHGTNPFASYPRVIGHEFAGQVTQVGAEVTHLQPGDKVAVDPVVSCGECYACRIGRPNVCKNLQVLGVHRDGGFQEFIAVDSAKAHKLPDHLPWEHAALVEPFTIAAQSAAQGRLEGTDTVLICGAGPIGLTLLQVAKMHGARTAVTDVVDSRLKRAASMGADLVINSSQKDLVAAMMEFTGGDGASLIFEATGNIAVMEQCIRKIAAIAGRVVILGMGGDCAQIAPVDFMRRELEVIGTRLSLNKFPQVVKWFEEGLVDPAGIISHVIAAADVQQAMDLTADRQQDVCKIVVTF